MTKPDTIHVYTDGACSGNPGPGGWGVVIKFQDCESELSGYNPHTTNNQMELQAAISALQAIPASSYTVVLSTDSNYVKDGITKWINNWIKNGWKTAARKPVKNEELWKELHAETQNRNIQWEWVKGHSGHPENERADALATGEIQKNR